MSKMSAKKPKYLTLKEKSDILNLLDRGHSVTNLAKKYGIAKSTVCAIKNKRVAIQSRVKSGLSEETSKTLRSSELPIMENELYKWLMDRRIRNIPISGHVLKSKAMELHQEINESGLSFHASDGWLQKFKSRFNIRLQNTSWCTQTQSLDLFMQNLRTKMNELGITTDQLYNAVESGLDWKKLPRTTFNSSGTKAEKEKLMFMCCSNATGSHKLNLLVLGRAKNPRCLEDYLCPAIYRTSKSGCVTSEIFYDWFHNDFIPEVTEFLNQQQLPVKALLLLDTDPSYPSQTELESEDGSICAMFLPPNVSSIIQPMNQNIFKIIKLYYRHSLLSSIVSKKADLRESIEKMTLKDGIHHLDTAWSSVKEETLESSWKNLLTYNSAEDDVEGNLEAEIAQLEELNAQLLHVLNPEVDVTTYLVTEFDENFEENLVDYEDIKVKNEAEDEDEDEEFIDCSMDQSEITVSHKQAVEAFDTVLKWGKSQAVDESKMLMLRSLREKAFLKMIESQTNE